jgi:hypothetical protein
MKKISKSDETITRAEFEAVILKLRDELIEMINARSGTVPVGADKSRPPKPRRTGPYGKKLEGAKNDIRCRIDSELFKILSNECDKNFSGNMSAALDAILWNYFDKPLLSFETPTNKEDQSPLLNSKPIKCCGE